MFDNIIVLYSCAKKKKKEKPKMRDSCSVRTGIQLSVKVLDSMYKNMTVTFVWLDILIKF